jgi:outer membrane receptor protein involved in Fe transport
MMKKALLICLVLIQAIVVLAQDGSLKGTVRDSQTKETLIGATVLIVGTYKGMACDIDGNYIIKDIKPGDYSIKVSFLGYADQIFNGIKIEEDKTKTLDIELTSRAQSIQEVVIVGEKNLVNLESAASEVKISAEEISSMNVRSVQDVVALQAGVSQTPDGLQIRGARVYETQYLVDGISAQDPLAGTGFGVEVSSGSIGDLQLITGGAGAEFGDGSSGVITTQIKEGSKTFEIAGNWQTDNFIGLYEGDSQWKTDNVELSFAGPVPFTNKKVTFFNNISMNLTDQYFGSTANQLHSSLFSKNDSLWAPRYDNKFSHTFKLAYQIKPGTKLTLTNQHSLAINQNTRSLQIVGFDAILAPGYQWERSLNLDNATTYTHHSNLTALNLNHFINNNLNLNISVGRLFTNLRADANGRPFRAETVDQIYDEESIVTNPVELFNPGDSVLFVLPGPGLVNNGGITSTWHDHYVEEYTIKTKFSYYPQNKTHKFSFGEELKLTEYQWVDVTAPWVGAPIQISDSVSTPSISIGSSNDIWKVNPVSGGLFFQDVITYKGIQATLGLRYNFWAPGKFADNAISDSTSPVLDQVRTDYMDETFGFFGSRVKSRLLPKVNVSFPVTENNILYFNYGHSMRLPHPRFVYAGLDPEYQDRSFLSFLGNPNLNPEINVSYEIGTKSQITKDIALTVSAFNNNRFDYIVQRRVLVKDQTGRFVAKRMYINQDYAKITGLELGIYNRIGRMFRTFFNATYQVARGKSNSAREAGLQIENNGQVELSTEQYLSFDRPWDLKLGFTFNADSTVKLGRVNFKNISVFASATYKSGFRYTPQVLEGYNDLGRPQFVSLDDQYLQEQATPWFWVDLKLSRNFFIAKNKGVMFTLEFKNITNHKNAQIINPVTGRAYEVGDDVPNGWRDPRYISPEENGAPPDNPARFLQPRQILAGLSFKF